MSFIFTENWKEQLNLLENLSRNEKENKHENFCTFCYKGKTPLEYIKSVFKSFWGSVKRLFGINKDNTDGNSLMIM